MKMRTYAERVFAISITLAGVSLGCFLLIVDSKPNWGALASLVCLLLFLLAYVLLRPSIKEAKERKHYLQVLSTREPISDSTFCRNALISSKHESYVGKCRSVFADYRNIPKEKIYPNDSGYIFGDFLDEDFEHFLIERKLIEEADEIGLYPIENVTNVASLIKENLKLKDRTSRESQ